MRHSDYCRIVLSDRLLGKEVAEQLVFASEVQVRGRGSPHASRGTRAVVQEPERMSNQRPKDRGYSAYVLLRVL